MINVALPSLSSQRALAKLLAVAAVHQHQTGDDAGAVESVRDILSLAGHIEDGEPFLITHLVRVAIDSLALQTVEYICRDLRVAPTGAQPVNGGATREAVHALMAELLDERSLLVGARMSLYGERLIQLDCVSLLVEGRMGIMTMAGAPAGTRLGRTFERLMTFVLGPAWKLDGLNMLSRTTRLADAIVADNWAVARSWIPASPPIRSGVPAVVHMMSSGLEASLDSAVLLTFRVRAERRMAAAALAIRLFELDHGRQPTVLDELVPDYLAAVPGDPFDADNSPLRYLPDAPSPRLYCVGSNGLDEGGAYKLKVSGGVDGDALDQPFFLNGDRPQPRRASGGAPTTSPQRAQDDDKVVDDGQGDDI